MDFRAYLFFGGDCRDAFTRYQEVFGGELVLLRMADVPSDTPVPAEQADLIIHAALTLDGAVLMGSDDPSDAFSGVQGMSVTCSVADADEAQRVLSAPSPTAARPRSLSSRRSSRRASACAPIGSVRRG